MVAGYQGYSNTDFARAAATTLADHIRELEDATTRNFPTLAQLEASGRISYNHGGRGVDWPVQYRKHNVEGNTGETQRNFARRNLYKTAVLEYRGYQATDAMYHKELKENNGPEGIVKVYNGFVDRITTSIRQALGKEIYTDGGASGNEKYWHGLESMFATNGTVTITTGAQRSTNTADAVGYPNDTYAGISTVLGGVSGDWETGIVWPDGDGDTDFDFWSPLFVHTAYTGFANFLEALRYGIITVQRNGMLEDQISTGVLSRTAYRTAVNLLVAKEEIQIAAGDGYSLRSLGFRNTFTLDGVEFTFDPSLSGTVGYGWSYANCELRCMDEQLLRPEGPEYDMQTQAYNAVVSTLSNLLFKSPRNHVKWGVPT
jgi:hypothetical protein